MTGEQFMQKRFIPKVAPIIIRRMDDFFAANNIYIIDDNTDIKAALKRIFE